MVIYAPDDSGKPQCEALCPEHKTRCYLEPDHNEPHNFAGCGDRSDEAEWPDKQEE